MHPKKRYQLTDFEWDASKFEKYWLKHNVLPMECEQIFFNQPLIVAFDEKHSNTEERYYALGRTDIGRHLFVVSTVRGKNIRVISARDMNRKEKQVYGT